MLLPSCSTCPRELFVKNYVIQDQYVSGTREIYQVSLLVPVETNEDPMGTSFSLFPLGFLFAYPMMNYCWAAKNVISYGVEGCSMSLSMHSIGNTLKT
jgi:hypothetical protein